MKKLEVEVSCSKANPVEIKVGNIDAVWGWDDKKEKFVKKMGSTTYVDIVRRKYIINEIKPQG